MNIGKNSPAALIRKHLEMDDYPTQQEIDDIKASLLRKHTKGTLDDHSELLAIQLGLI